MDDNALRDSLQELYEHAPCGYVFSLPDGTLTRVNTTFLELTGYSREDLLTAKRFQDLLTVPGRIFYENQYAPLLRLQGSVKEVAFDLMRKDGARLPVLVNAVQRTDSRGEPIEVASALFEATDRRRYEHELLQARKRAEQLAAVVTVSDDAILTVLPGGEVQSWNPGAARLFGYTAQVMVGRQLGELIPVLADAAEWQRLSHEMRAGRSVHVELVGVRVDGSRVDLSIGLAPHLGLLGELEGMSLIARDISHRRALERLQHEFLAMASHELRSPVAAIKIQAQIMKRREVYDERAADTIIAQADQLGRLIGDLLLASQIQAERLDLRLAEIDLATAVRAAADLQPGGRRIRVEAPSEPLLVWADDHRLAQVFANLLTNAAKYSPEGSEIMLRIVRQGEEAHVSVTDQGVGIPPEALPHLFERFYRVESTAGRIQGLGLGLYITRRIVEAHSGRIEVTSEPGRGSTFTVTLPLLSGATPPG